MKKSFIRYHAIFTIFLIGSIFYASFLVLAYKEKFTHPALTEQAAILYNTQAEKKLSKEEIEWLKKGSSDEDKAPRWLNHFYDPLTKEALKENIKGNPAKNAIEWAHSAYSQSTPVIGRGDYTWESAIYYYQNNDKQKAYVALGHVLHLFEDMGVPAHVRNDAHPEDDPYEAWVEEYAKNNILQFSDIKINPCLDLDQCFQNLAQYTNNNFFSVDTTPPCKYALPMIEQYEKRRGSEGIVQFAYSKDGILLGIVDMKESEWKKIIEPKITLSHDIHQSYFNNLAPKIISSGAGIIALFHEEVKKEQILKPIGYWDAKLNGLKSIVSNISQNIKEAAIKSIEMAKANLNDSAILNENTLTTNPVNHTGKQVNEVTLISYKEGPENTLTVHIGDNGIIEYGPNILSDTAHKGVVLGQAIKEVNKNKEETHTEILPQKTTEAPEPVEPKNENEQKKNINTEVLRYEEIKRVIDGDTIELKNGEKVRYIGIDTPELNKSGKEDDECLAWVARERNDELLRAGKEIILISDKGAQRDKYNRLLRYVYSNTMFVNRALALEGLGEFFACEPYMKNCPLMEDKERIKLIENASQAAQKAKRGIYSAICKKGKITDEMPEYEKPKIKDLKNLEKNAEKLKKNDSKVLILAGPDILENEDNDHPEDRKIEDAKGNDAKGELFEEEETDEKTDTIPPQSKFEKLEILQNDFLMISWDAKDFGNMPSGIKNYDLRYKIEDGEWQDFLNAAESTSTLFQIEEAHFNKEICFNVRASDKAYNQENWLRDLDEQIKCSYISSQIPTTPIIEYPEDGMVFMKKEITVKGTADLKNVRKKIKLEIMPSDDLDIPQDSNFKEAEGIVSEEGLWEIRNIELNEGKNTISVYIIFEDGTKGEKSSIIIEKTNDDFLIVVINEIGWAGTKASGNDEWLELYNNTGFPLDLTGWTLLSRDGSPEISLIGEILPYGYYLLERTDDNAILNITADQIYSGAMEDMGEILELRDAENNIIDYINCSKGWHEGNKNEKRAMERINPILPGDSSNWETNDGITSSGIDAEGNVINGTPRSINSATVNGGLLPHALEPLPSLLNGEVFLTRMGSPYFLEAETSVSQDAKVSIEKGTVIKAAAEGAFLVKGALNIFGTEKWPVVLTSIKDDYYAGDKNEDGNSSQPDGGDWHGVKYENAMDSLIDHAIFRYGGGDTSVQNIATLEAYGNKTKVTNSLFEFSHSQKYAVYFDSVNNTLFKNNLLRKNGKGIVAKNGDIIISDNILEENKGSGILLLGSATHALIDNNQVKNNRKTTDDPFLAVAIYSESPYFELNNNIFSGNDFDGIYLSSIILDDIILPKSTYMLGELSIMEEGTLTISRGTVFKNLGDFYLDIDGEIGINGNEQEKIIFTSFYDDSPDVGGDANNDNGEIIPLKDDWRAILLDNKGLEFFEEDALTIRYGEYVKLTAF